MTTRATPEPMALGAAFTAHHRYLWGVCYRMTGSAADADDLVQETFTRAVERPPADTERSVRPWLTKVAMNLARDAYRQRRRQKYGGDWLPAPIEILEHEPPAHELPSTEARYDLMESVSMAFLVALEALAPTARAVLLLRDVFDYSVRETSDALGMSESNVKTTLHRARCVMEKYDDSRVVAPIASETLAEFVTKVVAGDVAGVEALLAKDVVARSDGGGRYSAANKPVVGANKVARFVVNIAEKRGTPTWVGMAQLNGQTAILTQFPPYPGQAERVAMVVEVDEAGKIRRLYSQLVDEKLSEVKFG